MSKESILVIEDEIKILRLLELELDYEGYSITKASDGRLAFELFQKGNWDLILLDVMLPGMSGIEFLRKVRMQDSKTPVILLTARGSVEDKVSGLDLGANDYVTKPFEIEELLARIRAVLRRYEAGHVQIPDKWLSIADLKLNADTREVYRGEEEIRLTKREFDLLEYLLLHKHQVLSRDQILEAVWGFDFAGDTNVVDVYIRYLRTKLGLSSSLIHTVRGIGYCLKVK